MSGPLAKIFKKNVFTENNLSYTNNPATYRECLEKGSDDIGSAVCYTIYTSIISTYTISPSVHKQMIRYHSNPFREVPCI